MRAHAPCAAPAAVLSYGVVTDALTLKLAALERTIAGMGSAIVAYSGGVDSTFVAAVARDVLGERALAVTGISPSVLERNSS